MIEIIRYQHADKNKTIGYVDVKFTVDKPTTFIFRKLAHLKSDGKKWVNFPSFQIEDSEKKFFRFAEFECEPHNSKFLEIVSEEVKKYLTKNGELDDAEVLDFPIKVKA